MGQRYGGGNEDGFAVRRILRWSECALKGVRRIDRRLVPGEEGVHTGPREGKEALVAVLIASEETFCLQRFKIESIEEGTIAVRRGTGPGKEDGIGLLADHPHTALELAVNGIARALVMLIAG